MLAFKVLLVFALGLGEVTSSPAQIPLQVTAISKRTLTSVGLYGSSNYVAKRAAETARAIPADNRHAPRSSLHTQVLADNSMSQEEAEKESASRSLRDSLLV